MYTWQISQYIDHMAIQYHIHYPKDIFFNLIGNKLAGTLNQTSFYRFFLIFLYPSV
jgi:hypothetical protein